MVGLNEGIPFQQLEKGDAFLYFNKLYIKVNDYSAMPEDEVGDALNPHDSELVELVDLLW